MILQKKTGKDGSDVSPGVEIYDHDGLVTNLAFSSSTEVTPETVLLFLFGQTKTTETGKRLNDLVFLYVFVHFFPGDFWVNPRIGFNLKRLFVGELLSGML